MIILILHVPYNETCVIIKCFATRYVLLNLLGLDLCLQLINETLLRLKKYLKFIFTSINFDVIEFFKSFVSALLDCYCIVDLCVFSMKNPPVCKANCSIAVVQLLSSHIELRGVFQTLSNN